jgi:hypothetical protein
VLDLPPGWVVERDWEIMGCAGSPMAWEYAIGFRFPRWFDRPNCAARVRRRVWRRIVVDGNKVVRRPAEDEAGGFEETTAL